MWSIFAKDLHIISMKYTVASTCYIPMSNFQSLKILPLSEKYCAYTSSVFWGYYKIQFWGHCIKSTFVCSQWLKIGLRGPPYAKIVRFIFMTTSCTLSNSKNEKFYIKLHFWNREQRWNNSFHLIYYSAIINVKTPESFETLKSAFTKSFNDLYNVDFLYLQKSKIASYSKRNSFYHDSTVMSHYT